MNVLKKYYDGHGHGLDMENPTIKPTVKYYSVQFTNDIYFNCIYRSSQSLVTHEYVELKLKLYIYNHHGIVFSLKVVFRENYRHGLKSVSYHNGIVFIQPYAFFGAKTWLENTMNGFPQSNRSQIQ